MEWIYCVDGGRVRAWAGQGCCRHACGFASDAKHRSRARVGFLSTLPPPPPPPVVHRLFVFNTRSHAHTLTRSRSYARTRRGKCRRSLRGTTHLRKKLRNYGNCTESQRRQNSSASRRRWCPTPTTTTTTTITRLTLHQPAAANHAKPQLRQLRLWRHTITKTRTKRRQAWVSLAEQRQPPVQALANLEKVWAVAREPTVRQAWTQMVCARMTAIRLHAPPSRQRTPQSLQASTAT